ncbi:MAG: T9SS type A sorting domain-containing protein [Bacteroidota bacterium]
MSSLSDNPFRSLATLVPAACLALLFCVTPVAHGQSTTQITVDALQQKLPAARLGKFEALQKPHRLASIQGSSAKKALSPSEIRYHNRTAQHYLDRLNKRLTDKAGRFEQLTSQTSSMARANEQDSLALVALYNSTNGASWTSKSGWLTGALATWEGVTLDANGYVSELNLENNNLNGTIPAELLDLVDLLFLNLSDNMLRGNIPDNINLLSRLQVLDLSFNMLDGPIPSSIGEMGDMLILVLWGNSLNGEIPSSIGNLSFLEELWLFENELEGSIPPELGNLQNLNRLYLDQNRLTGDIPVTLGQLSTMVELFIDFNTLSGNIPETLGNLENLEVMYLGNNPLSGEIPESLTNLRSLKVFSIANAGISGEIPVPINNIFGLNQLDLSNNQVSGELPQTLNGLVNLTRLELTNNLLTGAIPANLGFSMPNLFSLGLGNNQLTGNIPTSLGFLPRMQIMDLSENELDGPIPGLNSSAQLRSLFLNDNQLSGDIAQGQMDALGLLGVLDLSNNNLDGELPRSLGGYVIMEELYLDGNNFTGALPATLPNLQNLFAFSVFENQLSGPVPGFLGDIPGLFLLDLGANAFSGTIPASLGRLEGLTFLLLDLNNLTGQLPSTFSNTTSLRGITMAGNAISGLPDLSALSILEIVEVELNRMSFEDIEHLQSLNLNTLRYVPQRDVYPIVDEAAGITRYEVDIAGSANSYQWYRNNTPISGATSAILELDNTGNQGSDEILAEITNSLVSDLVMATIPARTDAAMESLTIIPDMPILEAGETMQFFAIATDQFDNQRRFSSTWTGAGGTIDATGTFTAGGSDGFYDVTATDETGTFSATTTLEITGGVPVNVESPTASTAAIVHAAYPNPFRGSTQIAFELGETAQVHIEVYDMLGREMVTVVEQRLPAGSHMYKVDTANWVSGVYLYRMTAGANSETRSIVKLP